jgi:hypothetical protein
MLPVVLCGHVLCGRETWSVKLREEQCAEEDVRVLRRGSSKGVERVAY